MLQRLISLTDHRVRVGLLGVAAAALSVLGGCVGQQPYDQVMAENRSLKDQNQQLQAESQAARSETEIERAQRLKAEAALASLQDGYTGLEGRLNNITGDMNKWGETVAGIQFLDPATDRALRELADQYPDLIKYDSARGMLRFASDLTFDSGQDVVKPAARESLAALARILNSSAASQYEIHVVGHTDAQPISPTTAQRHPTNMHLSCHRAVSVRSELVNLGVAPAKVMAAGWGDQQPAFASGPKGNTPGNRRVEIFLTAVNGSESSATTDATPDREAPPTRQPEINK
jgi:chemotaxis protein MotB